MEENSSSLSCVSDVCPTEEKNFVVQKKLFFDRKVFYDVDFMRDQPPQGMGRMRHACNRFTSRYRLKFRKNLILGGHRKVCKSAT